MSMSLLQVLIGGLLLGAVYALFSSGLTLIWGMMNVVNFAHGDFVMIAMYIAFMVWKLLGGGPFMAMPIAAMLLATLGKAMVELRLRLGQEPSAWTWGALHHGYFEHPLADILPEMKSVGRLAKGGSGSTPMAASYRATDFRVTSGASFRMVADVGNWDASLCINAPGQSGDPRSAHYDDLAARWAAGAYVPLLYSAAAVDGAAELVIRLSPAPGRGAAEGGAA